MMPRIDDLEARADEYASIPFGLWGLGALVRSADAIGIARSDDTVRDVGGLLLEASCYVADRVALVVCVDGAVLSPEHVNAFVASTESTLDAERAVGADP